MKDKTIKVNFQSAEIPRILKKLKKNFKPSGTKKTYAEATKQGVCSQDLQYTVQNLMKMVQDMVKRTDVLSVQQTETDGKQKRRKKQISKGIETVLNSLSQKLTDNNYLLLSKGLLVCPKTRSHDKM